MDTSQVSLPPSPSASWNREWVMDLFRKVLSVWLSQKSKKRIKSKRKGKEVWHSLQTATSPVHETFLSGLR